MATVTTDADGEWSYNAGVLADGKHLVTSCQAGGSIDQILKLTVANGVVSTPEVNAAATAPLVPTVKMGDAYHVDATHGDRRRVTFWKKRPDYISFETAHLKTAHLKNPFSEFESRSADLGHPSRIDEVAS